MHRPVELGACDACHTARPESTPFASGVKHLFEPIWDDSRLCYSCHDSLDTQAFVHEPVRRGLCSLCHDPHASDRPNLLRVFPDRTLCKQCHPQTFDHGEVRHGPVKVGACGACHDPHQSAHPFRLRAEGRELCAICHMAETRAVQEAAHIHPPVAERCSNCHEPHESSTPRRLINVPPQLCLDCHDGIRTQLATGRSVHAPVAEGKCLRCHDQHASDHTRLLRAPFTEERYTAFREDAYDLCYRCHDREHVLAERTTSSTDFRNGDHNLHFVHVKREQNGRTCNICHHVHASSQDKLLKPAIRLGIFEAPLVHERTATGGRCGAACHPPRGYDRLQPVENK